jgi:hypothetical protein
MSPWIVALRGEASAMAREVEAVHIALRPHTLIVHDAVVLASVRASSVEEDDILVAIAGLLVENLKPISHETRFHGSAGIPCIVPRWALQ